MPRYHKSCLSVVSTHIFERFSAAADDLAPASSHANAKLPCTDAVINDLTILLLKMSPKRRSKEIPPMIRNQRNSELEPTESGHPVHQTRQFAVDKRIL